MAIRTLPTRRVSRRHRGGFTLMELLLVLAILVTLGALAGVSIRQMQKNANKNAAKAQIQMLEQAIDGYQVDVGAPPPDLESLQVQPDGVKNADKWQGPYLKTANVPNDPWGNAYQYETNGDSFTIMSYGPNQTEGGNDDITN